MKTIITFLSFFMLVYMGGVCFAQAPYYNTSPGQFQVNVTATSTPVILPSGTNFGWTIHPEGSASNIRCGSVIPGINPSTPTFEFLGNSYPNNAVTSNPTYGLNCISESGSTIVVDVWLDSRL